MSETEQIEVGQTDGKYRVKLPRDTCFYRVFGVVEKALSCALIKARNTLAVKELTLVAVEDECAELHKEHDALKAELQKSFEISMDVMRERDAKVTVEEVGKWMHSWLYTKNVIENRALEDAIRYIDDDQAGLAAWRNRQKPEDGKEGVEG